MNPKAHHKQSGAALLILFLIVFSATSIAVVAGLNNRVPSLQQEIDIREEMVLVKEALLAYSFNNIDDTNGPGHFPCANTDNNADDEDYYDNCPSSGGRLPERVELISSNPFQLSGTYSGIDQQFWFYVSENFTQGSAINTTTTTSLTLDGASDIVAVIIAPGKELSAQNRSSQDNQLLASNYLENSSNTDFINSNPDDPDNFNDRVLGITRNEVMTLATIKVAQAIEVRLNEFYSSNDFYPKDTTVTTVIPKTCYINFFGFSFPYSCPETVTTEITAQESFILAMLDSNGTVPSWYGAAAADWASVTNYTHDDVSGTPSFIFTNCELVTFSLIDNTLDRSIPPTETGCRAIP